VSWKLLVCVLFTVLAATLIPASGQDGGPPEGGPDRRLDSDKTAAERRRERNVETLRGMQGAWQLVELRVAGLHDAGRQDAGFLLVSSEFASLELHMAYFDEGGYEDGSHLETGTYRLNFNIYGDLVAKLLIGSIDDGSGRTVPREPGQLSVYEVRTVGREMTMQNEEGTRFVFEKMATGALKKLIEEEK
jgi:hypothetical protein